MTLMTFRTEAECDNENVPALLNELKVQLKAQHDISDSLCDDYKMGLFTIEVPERFSLEDFRKLMMDLINNDKRFVDMHRCYQTLNVGLEPDSKWYESD
jgi:hypothetical protein